MRLIIGLMFACHGAQKVLSWFANPGQPPAPPDMVTTMGGWIELICGLLIAIGLVTRPAAFLASGMMAVAYFMVHAQLREVLNPSNWNERVFPIVNHGESAVLYCWVFLFMFFYGPGRLSIDAMMKRGAVTSVPAT